jgi:hypothetical protein
LKERKEKQQAIETTPEPDFGSTPATAVVKQQPI